MVKGINLNLKLKVFNRCAPLKVFFSQIGMEKALKNLHVFVSYDAKEPSKQKNDGYYRDPTVILLKGQAEDQRKGSIFTKNYLYITVFSEVDTKVRVNSNFKEDKSRGKQIDGAK